MTASRGPADTLHLLALGHKSRLSWPGICRCSMEIMQASAANPCALVLTRAARMEGSWREERNLGNWDDAMRCDAGCESEPPVDYAGATVWT
jgi:hypothetical protein